MQSSRVRNALALTLGIVTTAGALTFAGTAAARPADPVPPAASGAVNIVDKTATPATKSLFSYLDEVRGTGVLFGQQNTTTHGLTFSGRGDGTQSDVKADVGDYPAVFGFDVGDYFGYGGGESATQTPAALSQFTSDLEQAHTLGGIPTISAHMPNFETGGQYSDTTGDAVSHILPGGDENAAFNAYLDDLATVVKNAKDSNGEAIPMIFRPFHENNGNWFWWGTSAASMGEFREIYRYTVEYLRDTQDVHNLLYAFSPNSSFAGDSQKYLATYPGDDWVDILGYDSYENADTASDSNAWISATVTDLAMITTVADQKGKIAAFTEFGRNGDRTLRPDDTNLSVNYFTDLLHGIEASAAAQRIAYMMTWVNWGSDQFYTPYPATGSLPAQQLLPDFQAFQQDPYSLFRDDVPADAETRTVSATPASPTLRVVTPADGVQITTPTTVIRVKATVDTPTAVWYTVGDDTTKHTLTLGADGYWEGTWDIGAENLTNAASELHVEAASADGQDLTAVSNVILGAPAVLPNGVVDSFEGYGDNAALQAAYTFSNTSASTLTLDPTAASDGKNGARFAYDFSALDYAGFGRAFTPAQDWSGFSELDAHLVPDASDQKLVLQFDAGGATFEAYPSLAGSGPVDLKIPFSDFQDKAGTHQAPTVAQLRTVTQSYVYLNKTDAYTEPSSIGLDDIHAAGTATDPGDGGGGTDQPTVVEDFESYPDTAALQSTWNGQSSGAPDLTLSNDPVGSGKSSGRFSFDFTGATDFAGVGRNLSQDWSDAAALSLWAKPTDAEQKITVQFVAGGVYYESSPVLTGTDAQTITIPFADAVPSGFQNLDSSLRPTVAQLSTVSAIALFVSKDGDPTHDTGAVTFDDITAEPSAATTPPGPVTIAVPTAPVWTDPCGPAGNGTWSGFADTSEYTWKVTDHSTLNGKVGIVVTAKPGFAFPDGARTQWTRTQDNSACTSAAPAPFSPAWRKVIWSWISAIFHW